MSEKLRETLLSLHRTLVGEPNATYKDMDKANKEFIHKQITDPGYEYTKKVKCHSCGELFKPFFFGDKRLDRDVMQNCVHCGEFNSFRPEEVNEGPPEEFVEGKHLTGC